MRPPGLFLLSFLPLASASLHRHHLIRPRRAPLLSEMSSLSISSPSVVFPSFPLTSIFPLPSTSPPSPSPSASDPTQSTFTIQTSSSFITSTISSASSPSSVVLSSSTPSSAVSTPVVTSTSSTSTAVQSQQSSSSIIISLPDAALASTQDSSSSEVILSSITATPSSTPTQTSSSGFFANTGAVASTFTVVGLVSIAGVIAVALLIARRRHSRSYEEDTEYLDKFPDPSADPPITQVPSTDDGSASDHAHYGAPPMALSTPPTAYYPDHPYAIHLQAFSPEAYPHSYHSPHPVASQPIHFPEDCDIPYPPLSSHVGVDMHNPHGFTDVELDSTLVPPTQIALPNALRPSVRTTTAVPKQWANTRFSVDSFYTGIATDIPPSPGRAI